MLRPCHNQTRIFLRQPLLSKPLRCVHSTTKDEPHPRAGDIGHSIKDEYAVIRDNYQTPKYPIVLAHGLLGFDELRLLGPAFPGIQYWRGIKQALQANGIEVITAAVGPTDSIERRGEALAEYISHHANGKSVNIIAHSMGGLDSRYMISRLKPSNVDVKSLTTIATPHRGSAFADYVFEKIGKERLPRVYQAMERMSLPTGAYSQLTRRYMAEEFNPKTPDREDVRYFSYGASCRPMWWSSFWHSEWVIRRVEGANDGLVSVESARWGDYKGTLVDVSHLDLINWTNRLRWMLWELTGNRRQFNAVAFYLSIADMLAKEGF